MTYGHRLIFCLHTPMITGGRTCSRTSPDLCDRLTDGELPEIRATATAPADTLAHMTTPPTARQRLAALHSYAAVNGEDFTGQNLASARTSQLRFTRCSFIGADLRHATLDGCWFKFCDFSGADLRGASLREVSLAGCDLRGADLRDTDLTDARFGSVNTGVPPLGLTNITGARFDGASLRNIQAEGVIGWPPGHGANE
ncbi:pentapeptide repeat-containing protein [Streptomyces sp. NBC_01451]|uniref:pentapeptide repeat-containing protein n=1 Tax=Streptomyces sp. NBC_01451 TaxID=2903872 RepID=UPI002E32A9E1|nr:pentapeptide repeat-containing protein [Streptomyces sp. NBC_01451]